MAEAIVSRALLLVLQDVIGFVDFLELVFAILVARVAVGMPFHRELAVRRLHLRVVRGALHAEDIKAKANTLAQASMKLGEAMYADAQKNAGGPGGPGADGGASAGGAPKDDVVDAEFTEVDDDKKNKKSA